MTEPEHKRKIERLRKQSRWVRGMWGTQALLCFILQIFGRMIEKKFHWFVSLAFIISSLCLWISTLALDFHIRRKLEVEEWQDLAVVLPVYALSRGKKKKHKWEPLLRKLLWQVSESNRPTLDPGQQSQLHEILFGDNRELVLATLNALKWLGNEVSILRVERLAKGKEIAWNDSQVREAAIESLAILRTRLEQEQRSGLLLRPSSPSADPATLLRSSVPTSPEDPATLLRAMNGKSED